MTPDQYTNKEFFIEVGDGHQLYAHDWGNPKGLPVIVLNGGPGESAGDGHKRGFDPDVHRVIFFDQRGCGKSLPYGSLEHNTTADMIEDITKIADHLGIKKFVLKGGSWGATLALAYALKYSKRIKAMVLYGIFTGAQDEIDYIDKGGFATHFPDAWQTYLDATPESHRHAPSKYHFARILGNDGQAARESALIYRDLEGAVIRLDDRFTPNNPEDFDPTGIQMEVYYMTNRCFLPDNYILDNAHKLDMPIWLVQGRYDMVCPPQFAYRLHKRLPKSRLVWTTSGHLGSERENHSVMRAILLQLAEKQ